MTGMTTNQEQWDYGRTLAAAIDKSGLSNAAVGKRTGISGSRIGHLIQGHAQGVPARPRTANVVRLASELKMDLRKALIESGKGDEIPEGMTDAELWEHFNHLLVDPLEKVSDEDLLAEVQRRLGNGK